jgi:hypothetical protein
MLLEELEEALSDILPAGFKIQPNKKGEMVIMTGLLLNQEGELIGVEEEEDDYEDSESMFEEMDLDQLSDEDDD